MDMVDMDVVDMGVVEMDVVDMDVVDIFIMSIPFFQIAKPSLNYKVLFISFYYPTQTCFATVRLRASITGLTGFQ